MIRLLKKAAIAALFVGMGAGSASALDIGNSGATVAGTYVTDQTFYLGASASQAPGTVGSNITFSKSTLTIGSDGVNTANSGTLTFGKLTFTTDNASATADALTINNTGMKVVLDELEIRYPASALNTQVYGHVSVEGGNELIVTKKVTLGSNVAGKLVTSDLLMAQNTGDRASLTFTGGLDLVNSTVTGNGDITGDVRLLHDNADIDVQAGQLQNYYGGITATAGAINVGANGAAGTAEMNVRDNLSVSGNTTQLKVAAINGNAELEVGKLLSINGTTAANAYAEGQNGNTATVNAANLEIAGAGTFSVGDNAVMNVSGDASDVAKISDGTLQVVDSGKVVFGNAVELGNGLAAGVIDVDGGVSSDAASVAFTKNVEMKSANSGIRLSRGGVADFSKITGGYSLKQGFIRATGDDNVIVADTNGLTIEGNGRLTVDANSAAYVMENTTMNYETEATGKVIVKRTNAIDLQGATSVLNTGDFTVSSDVTGATAQDIFVTNSGTLDVRNYTVEAGANVAKKAGVALHARGTATIAGRQQVAGTNTTFDRGMIITGPGGELATSGTAGGSATVLLGTTAANGNVRGDIQVKDGGKITAAGTNLLTFTQQGSNQGTMNFTGKTANTIQGDISANAGAGSSGFQMQVTSDLDMANANVYVNRYQQTKGTVQNINSGVSSVYATDTKQTNVISGADTTFAINGYFDGNTSVTKGATILGTGNIIGTGTAGANKAVLSLAGAKIDLSEDDLTLRDFGAVNMTSATEMLIGYNGTGVNQLILSNTALTAQSLAKSVKLNNDYLTHYYNNGSTVMNDNIIVGEIKGSGSWTVSNVFGDFGFSFDNTGAWLEKYDQTDLDNTRAVANQLAKNWDRPTISNGLAAAAAASVKDLVGMTGIKTDGSVIGADNVTLLQALATDNRNFKLTNGTTGTFDKGLLAAFNGQMAAAPVYVAQDTLRDIATTLHSRLDAYRRVVEYVNQNGIASSNALGSAGVLNERYMNRLWVGGLGTWQNADKRKGFDGWKYDGAGVMLGYDRAAGAAIFGFSASYVEGDYEDKTATGHDSKIKQYAANAYATYNFTSGMFATLVGGYSYADNDISEIRGGNRAREDYHTNTWYAGARLGYDIEPCDNFSISPSVGADFFYSRANGHRVDYAGQSMWGYSAMKNHNVEIPAEVKVAYEVNMGDNKGLTLMASGGYAYNLNDHGVRGDVGLIGTDVSYRNVGRQLGHHSWKAGAGAKLRWNQWDVGVKYDYYGRSNYDAHRVTGQVGFNF